jgi:predicted NBD/HSP70 family sugar kinase
MTGLVQNANSTWLIDLPLDRLFAEALDRPVRVANDADCFALSEAIDGAGAGARIAFGVILGTGVGGGIVVDGRLLAGPNAIMGEWGAQSPPRPNRCRASGASLLLRPPWLHRDLAIRPGLGGRSRENERSDDRTGYRSGDRRIG